MVKINDDDHYDSMVESCSKSIHSVFSCICNQIETS